MNDPALVGQLTNSRCSFRSKLSTLCQISRPVTHTNSFSRCCDEAHAISEPPTRSVRVRRMGAFRLPIGAISASTTRSIGICRSRLKGPTPHPDTTCRPSPTTGEGITQRPRTAPLCRDRGASPVVGEVGPKCRVRGETAASAECNYQRPQRRRAPGRDVNLLRSVATMPVRPFAKLGVH